MSEIYDGSVLLHHDEQPAIRKPAAFPGDRYMHDLLPQGPYISPGSLRTKSPDMLLSTAMDSCQALLIVG